jgi:Family of unknown function (DUF5691)
MHGIERGAVFGLGGDAMSQPMPQASAQVQTLAAEHILIAQQALYRVALLGTDRAARQLPSQPLPTGAAQGINDAPTWALQWLAQTDLIRRAAGTSVAVRSAPPLQAHVVQGFDAPRFLPPTAQDALAQCLELGLVATAMVTDLLTRAHAGRWCLPYSQLPATLDYLAIHAQHCVVPLSLLHQWHTVLGERGQWLAQHNPAWASVLSAQTADTIEPAQWALASVQQRLALLRQLRGSGVPAATAQARGLIESTRASDPPAEVAQHLQACEQGIAMDDHDWLETLLDAKHKSVRKAALACLTLLPHSALCLRAVGYLTQPNQHPNNNGTAVLSLNLKRGLFGLLKGNATLEVALPNTDAYDKAMEKTLARDGYDIKAHPSVTGKAHTIGPKMSLVLQWLSLAPLDVLCEHMEVSNVDLFTCAAQHESGEDLIAALAQGLLAQARAPAHVIDALLGTGKVSHEMQMALIARLTFEQKEAHIMKPDVIPTVNDLCTVFTATQGMGAALSHWVLNMLRRDKHDYYNTAWNSSDTIAFAQRLDLDKAQAFVAEARAEHAQNQPDTPSNKACYDASFWQPLFQAIDITVQYRRALATATP